MKVQAKKAAVSLLFVGWVFLAVAWNSYVLTKLWGWYVVPTFGVAPIRVVSAYGLSLIAHFLQSPHDTAEDKREWYMKFLMPLMGAVTALFAGWVGTFFL